MALAQLTLGSEDDHAKDEGLDKPDITRPKPQSISNLSDEELVAMEKKMVRKVDLVVM